MIRKRLLPALSICLAAASSAAYADAWEPPVSLILGGTLRAPFGAKAHADYRGGRAGVAVATSLSAGEVKIPLELGLAVSRAGIGFDGLYQRDVFTDLQFPVIFHGSPWGNRLEILAVWIPSYTVEMASVSSTLGYAHLTKGLRTRFNMGFGPGMQLRLPAGIRLRSHWVYDIFSPYPVSRLTFGDWNLEAALPLWKRRSP